MNVKYRVTLSDEERTGQRTLGARGRPQVRELKRAGVDVLLRVDPARRRAEGFGLFRSPNGVLLARRIPPGCITGLRAETRRARAEEPPAAGALRARGVKRAQPLARARAWCTFRAPSSEIA